MMRRNTISEAKSSAGGAATVTISAIIVCLGMGALFRKFVDQGLSVLSSRQIKKVRDKTSKNRSNILLPPWLQRILKMVITRYMPAPYIMIMYRIVCLGG